MLFVLRAASNGEVRLGDVEQRLADELKLSPDERAQLLPSGRQRVFYNRVQWAKTYLTKAGLLVAPARGRFAATDEGLALLARRPERIDNTMLLKYPAFREFQDRSALPIPSGVDAAAPFEPTARSATPEESIEAAFAALQGALRAELLERILQNSPTFFETVIIDLLVGIGYGGSHKNAVAQLGRSGDGGVDGVISEDILGLDRIYVQAKRYAPGHAVGRPEIQAFTGSLVGLGANKGVFVTTSTFSAQATEFVNRVPQRLVLIDGQRLTDLMVEHDIGVRTSRQLAFKRVDEDFFSEET